MSTDRPRAAGGAHPRHAPAPARRHGRVPGRARLERYVDHAGVAAGRGQPRRPAAPLPDQERPRARGRRAPRPTPAGRSSQAAGGRAAHRPAPHPRRPGDARASTSPARCSPPRSSCGSRPAPTPRSGWPSARSSSGSAARRTARTVELLGFDESRARGPRAGAGHPRPGPRPRPGQHDHRRHRPPRPDPRRLGRRSSTTRGPGG